MKSAFPPRAIRSRARVEPAEERLPMRERVLSAAFSSFMEKGYAGTSTLDIATRAKVSKRELYAICADKSELLREAVVARADRMRLPLELEPAEDDRDLERVLTAFALAVVRGVCERPVLAVFRLAIAEGVDAPEVVRVLDRSRQANRDALNRTIEAAQRSGFLQPGDAVAMTTDFLGLLWGDNLLKLLLRVMDPPSSQMMERMAARTVKNFLALYRRAGS